VAQPSCRVYLHIPGSTSGCRGLAIGSQIRRPAVMNSNGRGVSGRSGFVISGLRSLRTNCGSFGCGLELFYFSGTSRILPQRGHFICLAL